MTILDNTGETRPVYSAEHDRMAANGWEYVGERGGRLWELYRGCRIGHVITDVQIADDGLGLWIKTALSASLSPDPLDDI